ncbi:hypothetical protein ACET3X_003436 [Alternaria dauci]|uniref:BTB domain-containing protein n=1 Tax=Alternaria dauci TaxID=48095 RepID=A0ABR3UUP3_9PLEO
MSESKRRSDNYGLFNNPALSDVTIKQVYKGQRREYYAHKTILCLESGYFFNAFTGGFREASEGTMELHEDNPEHFECLLKFIYSGTYDKDEIAGLAGSDKIKRVLIPIGIYTVADKYDVSNFYGPAADDVKDVLTKAFRNQDMITAAIEAHYSTEVQADGLMGRLITTLVFNQYKDLLETEKFEQLLIAHPAFATDVILYSKRCKILGTRPRAECETCLKEIVEIDFMYTINTFFYCPFCGSDNYLPPRE